MVCEAGGDSTDIMPAVCHGAIPNNVVHWNQQLLIKKRPFVMSYEFDITGRSFLAAGKIAFIVAGGIVIFSNVYVVDRRAGVDLVADVGIETVKHSYGPNYDVSHEDWIRVAVELRVRQGTLSHDGSKAAGDVVGARRDQQRVDGLWVQHLFRGCDLTGNSAGAPAGAGKVQKGHVLVEIFLLLLDDGGGLTRPGKGREVTALVVPMGGKGCVHGYDRVAFSRGHRITHRNNNEGPGNGLHRRRQCLGMAIAEEVFVTERDRIIARL